MGIHVVVGAGPVGSGVAELLAAEGHTVRIVTRSGSGPQAAGFERVRADAADVAALTRVSAGAVAIYNCANPPYHRWLQEWPPLAASMLAAAERSGAVLVTMSNLYGYGPVDHTMRETDPLAATGTKGRVRADMWREALAAHEAGRVRATEARASDFFGPGATNNVLGQQVLPRLGSSKSVMIPGRPSVLHSWTYVPDVARALVVLGREERAWGRPWHVPTNPPMSLRDLVDRIAALAGVPTPKLRSAPRWLMRAAGTVSPLLRELDEVRYQFDAPFVVDSTAFTATFGIDPTPMDTTLASLVEWWRATSVQAA